MTFSERRDRHFASSLTGDVVGGTAEFVYGGLGLVALMRRRSVQLPGPRQSLVIMAGCCGDTPGLAFSRPGW
jgi:hypothetical protein